MVRLLSIPAALILLLAGAMAWSRSATEPRADFTFCIPSDILKLDPNQMSYLQDIRIAYGLWEGLYTQDAMTLDAIPGVATSADVSADSRVYTFHLRPEARWSNGDAVTTADFVFAWRRMLESPGEYSYLFYYIRGAEAYLAAYQEFLKEPDAKPKPDFKTVGIEALDPHTLRVTLDNPVPFIYPLMAFPPFLPLHEPSMRKFATTDPKTGNVTYDGKFTRPGVITNGPFKLAQWEFKRTVRLEQNPYYWDRVHVKSKSIEMQVVEDPLGELMRYESGAVDWLPEPPPESAPEMLQQGRKDLHVFPGFGTVYLAVMVRPKFKNGSPNPLADLRVRQALAMGIDRKPIVQNITRLGELPATTYVPPGIFPGFEVKEGIDFDPKRGRELLAEAGIKGRTLPGLSLIFRGDRPTWGAICQNVANQWSANLGIDVPLEQMESKVARQRLNDKDFSVAAANWMGDYRDPSTFTDKYRSTSENNDSGWINPQFDALLDAATREADQKKRYQLLETASHMIDTELPIIPLYGLTNKFLYRDNVHGISLDPQGMTMFKGVYVQR